MKKGLLTMLVIALLTLTANLTMAQTYTYPVKGNQGFTIPEKTRDGMRINYQLGQFSLSQLNFRGEDMSEISISSIALPNTAGSPNLPSESRMMAIPNGAKATLNVVNYETELIHNVNIAPALRIQAENEEPDMNYVKDMKVYSKNAFYPENPFTMGETYIRGVNAVTVAITPFQYNPVTKDLLVYTNVELSVSYEGGDGHFGEDRLRSPYWDPILAAELMNYDQLPVIDYEGRMQEWLRDGAEGAEYLIITPNNDAWAEYANQLKDFRMKQGIITKVYRLDEMPASNTNAMKEWFHNAYHTWEIAPVAVCLFGDHNTNMSQGIPAETTDHPYNGSCITDNFYSDAEGGDNLPDMVFSRLVARDASELPIFVSKQIDYETTPNTDASFYHSPVTALGWQTERWFQLCSEVFGGYMRNHGYDPQRINCIYDGTPGSVWSSNENTSMVVDYFGPSGTGYIPAEPSELGGWTGGSPEQVVDAVNNGTFWVQHRDHGLDEGWGEPAVRNNHIDQMNNVGKLPFVMSINCQTGMFNYTGSDGNCFTEKWMRRTSNGQNAGAVGVLSPTEVSYSFVNDAFVWGVYDLFDGDFMPTYGPFQPAGPQTGNWRPAFGNVAGKYFLAQSSWPYNENSKDITYTMFTAHCDAFLRIFTQVPETMTVNHQNVQLAGLDIFQITAPEGTTIALTKGEGENLEIVAVATGTGSVQNIIIPTQVPPTVLKLTVTGQNYLRYEADIEVIPASGPYVIIDSYELINNASQLNFGENAGFDLVFKNVGSETAPAGTATLTSDSEYITITNGTVDIDAIASNNTFSINNAFTFTVSDEVPNKTPIDFLVTISSGDDSYESHISLKAFAPIFKVGDVNIEEITGNGNGRLDPGETVKFAFSFENKGNATSREIDATLNINNIYMQLLDEPTITLNGIASGATGNAEFSVYIGNAPSGATAEYNFEVTSGVYTDNKDFMSKIALNVEDFELGELDPSLWTNNSSTPWTRSTDSPYEGNYCMKSGGISDNSETELSLNYIVSENDNISFFYKVSSEGNYDKLHFYIDGQEKDTWSGNVAWNRAEYSVRSGQHTFTWKYTKDQSVSSGDDCAWIDFVVLPRDMSMVGGAGLDLSICQGETVQLLGYASNYDNLLWTTSGDGTFDDATIANASYTPGPQDIANGSVTLTITINGSGSDPIVDDMTLSIYEGVTISTSYNNNYCAAMVPQAIGVEIVGEYTSFNWITSGDGTFEDATALETTYTPGPQDIANGVSLTAKVKSAGCGSQTFDYAFEMSPAPEITLEAESGVFCEGEHAVININVSGISGTGTVVINGTQYDIDANATSINLGELSAGTTVFNITEITGECTTYYNEGELSFTAEVNSMPQLTLNEMPASICEGEELTLNFTFTGVGPFTVEAQGLESFTTENDSYTMTLTPTENVNFTLISVTESHGCMNSINQSYSITVEPTDIVPLINGALELDVYYVPVSNYNVANDVMVNFTMEPEDAGTITVGEDGKTIDITWRENFKGEVVLTATPQSECNSNTSSLTINVKNTTDVNELSNSAKIYPNPTSEKVNIECAGMTHVTVFNTMGQMVYNADVDTDKVTVNAETLPAGSYLVRITTAEGSFTKHLSVIK